MVAWARAAVGTVVAVSAIWLWVGRSLSAREPDSDAWWI